MPKRTLVFLLVLIAAASAQPRPLRPGAGRPAPRDAALFQVSTLDALLQGVYGASMTVGELRRHGDFGLGTYEGVDGEMILLDGRFYQVRFDGSVTEASADTRTPFAAVTDFRADSRFTVKAASITQLGELIDTVLPSKNLFYAIRVHGPFAVINTRSVARQFLPYPPLASVTATQALFTNSNIVGTAVGIRCPTYVSGVNQAGYHFHFLSDDRKAGGHALSFTTGEVTVEVMTIRQHSVWLPGDEPFLKATLPFQQ
ncbi:MAG TPA: acetolactate decarboxylase [Vicinamibacterales bacterium]|nr:acetolactate decarboxylase [Vicinamibacterales bacterium]